MAITRRRLLRLTGIAAGSSLLAACIVLGGDNFHSAPGARTPFARPQDNSPRARILLQQLPADLAKRLASENALRLYKMA